MAVKQAVKQAVANVMKTAPQISGIVASDFGLKAGFWDRQKPGTITFRPLVGWVSVTNYVDAGRLPFCGVMLNNTDSLSIVGKAHFPDFVGYFKNNVTADEARRIIESEGIRVGDVRGVGRPVE